MNGGGGGDLPAPQKKPVGCRDPDRKRTLNGVKEKKSPISTGKKVGASPSAGRNKKGKSNILPTGKKEKKSDVCREKKKSEGPDIRPQQWGKKQPGRSIRGKKKAWIVSKRRDEHECPLPAGEKRGRAACRICRKRWEKESARQGKVTGERGQKPGVSWGVGGSVPHLTKKGGVVIDKKEWENAPRTGFESERRPHGFLTGGKKKNDRAPTENRKYPERRCGKGKRNLGGRKESTD